MSKKFLTVLSSCKFCGGLPEMRKEPRYFRNKSFKVNGAKFYVRCSQCHARTPAHKRIEVVTTAWNMGNVFRPVQIQND